MMLTDMQYHGFVNIIYKGGGDNIKDVIKAAAPYIALALLAFALIMMHKA